MEDIVYGKVALLNDEFNEEHCRIRFTAMFKLKLVKAYRAKAKELGISYRDLIEATLDAALEKDGG
jgi:hypothetical protein